MLYDPKWNETKADPFTLPSLIAWLEKQPANADYSYMDCKGGGLYGLYMASQGIGWIEAKFHSDDRDDLHRKFRREVYSKVAFDTPWTFGAALKRARGACD